MRVNNLRKVVLGRESNLQQLEPQANALTFPPPDHTTSLTGCQIHQHFQVLQTSCLYLETLMCVCMCVYGRQLTTNLPSTFLHKGTRSSISAYTIDTKV